jgi:hypothetical protein
MYAAMSYAVGHVEGRNAIAEFGRDGTWVALAVWALVAGATLWHAVRLLIRREPARRHRATPRCASR